MESKEKRKMDEMLIKEYDDVLKKVHSEWKALPESRKKRNTIADYYHDVERTNKITCLLAI